MLTDADYFSRSVLRDLRERYRTPSAVSSLLANGLHTLEDAQRLAGADGATGVAALESFLSDVLIAQARGLDELSVAQQLSMSALTRIERSASHSLPEAKGLAVHLSLLLAISKKAAGDLDGAFTAIEKQERWLVDRLEADWLDLIALRRQRALMLQRAEAFLELANGADAYRHARPGEYYATIKRVFEYLLNTRNIETSRALFAPLRSAYALAAARLPLVAHVSFLKNVGHFLILDGYPRKGSAILVQALRAASQLNLFGQARQVNRLLDEVSGGSPILEVFQV